MDAAFMDVKKKCGCNGTMIEEVCFKIRTVFIAAIHNWTQKLTKKQKSFPRVPKNCVSEAAILKKFSNLQAA